MCPRFALMNKITPAVLKYGGSDFFENTLEAAADQPCYSFVSGGPVRLLDKGRYEEVCHAPPAAVVPAYVGISCGMDNSFRYDGTGLLLGVYLGWKEGRKALGPLGLRDSASCELWLAHLFLQLELVAVCLLLAYPIVGHDFGRHCPVLPHPPRGGAADDTLSGLGGLCGIFELWNLSAKLKMGGQLSAHFL